MNPVSSTHQFDAANDDGQRPNPEADAYCESVAILLCTHDGEAFLPEQLNSIRIQSHKNWRLIVSDDNSSDGTRGLLAEYKSSISSSNRVEIRDGPRRGSTINFMSLATDPAIKADYFAFSDQDDIWRPNKLERALAWLRPISSHIPAMYGSRTRAVASDGRPLYLSPLFRKPATFRNALVQNIAGGNTIVMNRAAHAVLVDAGPIEVVAHDWWTYQLVSGAGGIVLYDPAASLEYRQHGNNQIGANQGIPASLKRLRLLVRGQLIGWNKINSAALLRCACLLTPENRQLLESFCAMRTAPLLRRIKLWRKVRPYRQTTPGQLALLLAALANKL